MEELHLQKPFHLLYHQILPQCPQKYLNTSSFHCADTSIVEGRMRKAGYELLLDKLGGKWQCLFLGKSTLGFTSCELESFQWGVKIFQV